MLKAPRTSLFTHYPVWMLWYQFVDNGLQWPPNRLSPSQVDNSTLPFPSNRVCLLNQDPLCFVLMVNQKLLEVVLHLARLNNIVLYFITEKKCWLWPLKLATGRLWPAIWKTLVWKALHPHFVTSLALPGVTRPSWNPSSSWHLVPSMTLSPFSISFTAFTANWLLRWLPIYSLSLRLDGECVRAVRAWALCKPHPSSYVCCSVLAAEAPGSYKVPRMLPYLCADIWKPPH